MAFMRLPVFETISHAAATAVYYSRGTSGPRRSAWTPLRFATRSGFGNDFASEALPGALPIGQSNPQQPPYGLYTEEINGTRVHGAARREPALLDVSHPSVGRARAVSARSRGLIRSAPFDEAPASPNQLRWRPLPIPKEPTDFVAGLVTMGGNGDPGAAERARPCTCTPPTRRWSTASSTTPTASC